MHTSISEPLKTRISHQIYSFVKEVSGQLFPQRCSAYTYKGSAALMTLYGAGLPLCSHHMPQRGEALSTAFRSLGIMGFSSLKHCGHNLSFVSTDGAPGQQPALTAISLLLSSVWTRVPPRWLEAMLTVSPGPFRQTAPLFELSKPSPAGAGSSQCHRSDVCEQQRNDPRTRPILLGSSAPLPC